MIEVIKVSKRYGSYEVLNDVTFKVSKNEVTVLLGPNGAGKTTLLNIIAGIVDPDLGTIIIDDKVVFQKIGLRKIKIPPEKRCVGYVPHDYALFPHLTVYENIAFGLKARKYPNNLIRERVKELSELLNLKNIMDRYPHQLSNGEKQKVALARALAPQPKILLLDEPLSSIDPGSRENIRWELKNFLKELKITTLMVTHDLNDAWTLADKVMVLLDGSIAAIGELGNFISKIKCKKVADFVGLNTFEAVVIDKNKKGIKVYSHELEKEFIVETTHDVSIGDKVLLAFRPDDIIILKNRQDVSNVVNAKIRKLQITKCNVKITLEISKKHLVNAEISRGYFTDILNNISVGSSVWIRIPTKCLSICKL